MQPKAETQAMSEYGEPWRYDGANMLDIENSGGDPVVSVGPFGSDTVLMRVVSCVNAMQGIPNPEAVRELIEAATEWYGSVCKHGGSVQVPDTRLRRAVAALTAPSASPQQK